MMKKYLFCLFCLLLIVVTLIGLPYEQTEEYIQKQAILNERAARFKAETGFEGDITYNYQYMKFSHIIGNFRDIVITAPQDTVYMKQVFDRVLAKVKPYISAQEGQLYKDKIVHNNLGSSIIYRQMVNGYRVEGGGSLRIHFNFAISKFSITDATADISSEIVQVNITEDQAINAVLQRYDTNEDFDRNHWMFRRHIKLVYAPIEYESGVVEFKLCYLVSFGGGVNYVDPTTGEVIYTRKIKIANDNCYVTGDIYETAYTSSNILQLPNSTLSNIKVMTDNFIGYTDTSGFVVINDSTYSNLSIELEYGQILSLCEYPNTNLIVKADSSNIFVSGNTIRAHFPDNQCNSTNIYYHILDQFFTLNSMSSVSNSFGWKIISNSQIIDLGYCDPSCWEIHIRYDIGQFSHVSRHELSHAFIYDKLENNFFHNSNSALRAMDEAFAVYLPCDVINSHIYVNELNSIHDIRNFSVSSVQSNYYQSDTLNEDFYTRYYCRYPLASAWWEIKNNIGEFTQFLIDRLIIDVSPSDSLRYKPRYFYNILMRNSTTANQLIIDKAYSDRGLHFTPQVISAGVSNPPNGRDKNMFRIGDPVYVKVTNCPQNTPLTVYVVEDQNYTDGMNISALNAIICQVSGTSDNDGVWYSSTPVMTASDMGDYDILVDIGNNGVLHFAYNGANVRDGFDGLSGPGFSVFDDGIDVVLALDLSQSMAGECVNLHQLTRRYINTLLPGDKINIFSFNEGIAPYWNGGFIKLFSTPGQFGAGSLTGAAVTELGYTYSLLSLVPLDLLIRR